MKIHPHLILPTQNSTQLQPQFSSPPPSMLTSPGSSSIYAGVDEGGRLSHSPNQLNAHACSHGSCSASFPTFELLEKHEIINHSSGATSVVCTTQNPFYVFQPFFLALSLSLALVCTTPHSRSLVFSLSLVALVFLFSLSHSLSLTHARIRSDFPPCAHTFSHNIVVVAPAFAPFFPFSTSSCSSSFSSFPHKIFLSLSLSLSYSLARSFVLVYVS